MTPHRGPHTRDGAGLGSQHMLADLRSRHLLDKLSDGVQVDHIDAHRADVRGGRGDHLSRGDVRPALGRRAIADGHLADLVFALASILTPFALGPRSAGSLRAAFRWATPPATSSRAGSTRPRRSSVRLPSSRAPTWRRWPSPGTRVASATRSSPKRSADALAMAVVAGAIALGGLAVIRDDAPSLYRGLTHGAGLACVIVSVLAGVVTIGLVWVRRFELSRVTGRAPSQPSSPAGPSRSGRTSSRRT